MTDFRHLVETTNLIEIAKTHSLGRRGILNRYAQALDPEHYDEALRLYKGVHTPALPVEPRRVAAYKRWKDGWNLADLVAHFRLPPHRIAEYVFRSQFPKRADELQTAETNFRANMKAKFYFSFL